VTKSNSTQSTLLKLVKIVHVTLAAYTLATKSKGRSTFWRQKSPTFNKVDRVGNSIDRDKIGAATVDFVAVLSLVSVTVDCVASVFMTFA